MKVKKILKHLRLPALYALVCWTLAWPLSGQAAITPVTIGDDFFNPSAVTINVNDQVLWTWAGAISHSTTSTSVPRLWDSGLKVSGTFANTFTTAGSFPYFCTLHTFMNGSVTVQSGNVPPTVSITAPANGRTFAAPWTGAIQATVSDTDGTVSKVDFFAGTTLLGTINNPPPNPSFTVTNLAAGNFTLKAVATDNGGATNTSAGVAISVVTPAAIVLSSPQRMSATSFQFSYSATPGLSYVVFRSGALPVISAISTNTANSSSVTFLDNSATDPANFYGVHLVPNP